MGHSIAQVASLLMISEETVRYYCDQYQQGGMPTLLKTNYKGSSCKLSESEIERRVAERQSQIYLTTQTVIVLATNTKNRH